MGQMAEQMADYYADNMLRTKDQRRRLAHEAFTAKLFTAIHNAIKLNEKNSKHRFEFQHPSWLLSNNATAPKWPPRKKPSSKATEQAKQADGI